MLKGSVYVGQNGCRSTTAKFDKKKQSVTEVLGRLLKKKVKPLRRRSSAVASVTHIILCRRRHCDHHMTLSDPFPWCRFLGHGDGHGQVAGPRPQHRWVRDGHVDVVAVLREVGLPDGLNRREQPLDGLLGRRFFSFFSKHLWNHHNNQVSGG